uniref:KEN domain-containing protein n=1 Tax=Hydatigena taeniaeformis TaxID=6205 RepID=A0A0R3WTC0_HYDTA
LTQLLRAIRNKRNHIWSLRNTVRDVLGSSDTAMAQHWNSRFPSLLPLTYCLARVHLAKVDHFRRFLPAPLTSDAAERFIGDCCHPSAPAMWARLPTSEKVVNGINSCAETNNNIADIKLQVSEHGSPLQAKSRVWSKVRNSTNPWHLPSRRLVPGEASSKDAAITTFAKTVAAALPPPMTSVSGEMADSAERMEETDTEDGFVFQRTRKRTRKRKNAPNNAKTMNL